MNRLTAMSFTFLLVAPLFGCLVHLTGDAGAELINPASLTPHSPISITSNSGFVLANGVIAGTGSASDPFIIENWTINASTANGIYITNTDKHFILRNNLVYNGSYQTSPIYHGIYISNVRNATVENNKADFNKYGIWIRDSTGLLIANNTAVNCTTIGLYMGDSGGNILYNNTMYNNKGNFAIHGASDQEYMNTIPVNNTVDGKPIYVWVKKTGMTVPSDAGYVALVSCNNVVMRDLTLSHNYYIPVINTTNSTLDNNTILNNTYAAIVLTNGGGNNTISNNTFAENIMKGVQITGVNGNLIYNNTFYSNFDIDLELSGSMGNNISHNRFPDAIGPVTTNSIYVDLSDNNLIEWNTGSRMAVDIDSDSNKFCNNTFTGSGLGLSMVGWGNHNEVFDNVFRNLTDTTSFSESGLWIGTSRNLSVHDNLFENIPGAGILILMTNDRASIHDNELRGNDYGIDIDNGENVVIFNNSVHNNTHGIRLFGNNITMANNTMANNTYNFGVKLSSSMYQNNVSTNNTVDGRPVYYWLSQNDKAVPLDAGFFSCYQCNNVTARDINVSHNIEGIYFYDTDRSLVENVTMDWGEESIYLGISDYNVIRNNTVSNSSKDAIRIEPGVSNSVVANNISICQGNGIYSYWAPRTDISSNQVRACAVGIYMRDEPNNIDNVTNNTIYGGGDGLVVDQGQMLNIGGNRIHNNTGSGIKVIDNTNVTMFGNAMENNTFNLWVNKLIYYNISTNNTVNGKPVYYWWKVSNQTVPKDAGFVALFSCVNITMDGLILQNNSHGAMLVNATQSRLTNSTINGTEYGVYLAPLSYYNTISNDSFEWNEYGITFDAARYIEVANNSVRNSTSAGLSFLRKWVDINSYLMVYNNYFSNTNNVYDEDWAITRTENKFNTSQTVRRNIVGGSFTGGNFWSDYPGNDTNGDGIGDTSIKWHGDSLPLVPSNDTSLPGVKNNTTKGPTTGDPYQMSLNAWDDRFVAQVSIDYDFDDNKVTSAVVPRTHGGPINGTYNITISVPSNATELNITVRVLDSNWNWAYLDIDLPVQDNDAPSVADQPAPLPTTGDPFNLSTTSSDNIAVSSVHVEYWFNNGPHSNTSLVPQGAGIYTGTVQTPTNATGMSYFASSVDASANWNTGTLVQKPVMDNDPPEVSDLTAGVPVTGYNFTLTARAIDNIAMNGIQVEYWYDNGTHTNGTMTVAGDYYLTIGAPKTAKVLNYILKATDMAGNTAQLPGLLNIIDTVEPSIMDSTGIPTTGDMVEFKVSVADNWQVAHIYIEYWFDDGPHVNVTYSSGSNVSVPSNARVMHYRISAEDTSGNWAVLVRDKQVVDNDAPSVKFGGGIPTTGDTFNLVFEVTDNIGLNGSFLKYSFVPSLTGEEWNVSFNGTFEITVPDYATSIKYTVYAYDAAENSVDLTGMLEVVDNDAPVVEALPVSPETGKDVELRVVIHDGSQIAEVELEYWYDSGNRVNAQMEQDPDDQGQFSCTVTVPGNAVTLHYIVKPADAAGNTGSSEFQVPVRDIIPPDIFDAISAPAAGLDVSLDVQATDNVKVTNLTIEYWFDDGAHETKACSPGSKFPVPMAASKLHYIIKASDAAGNERTVNGNKVVVNIVPPSITDLTGGVSPVAGETFTVTVAILENSSLTEVVLEVWYDGQPSQIPMTRTGGQYTASFKVEDAKALHYRVKATDRSGNTAQTPDNELEIKGGGTQGAVSGSGAMLIIAGVAIAVVLVIAVLAIAYRKKK